MLTVSISNCIKVANLGIKNSVINIEYPLFNDILKNSGLFDFENTNYERILCNGLSLNG